MKPALVLIFLCFAAIGTNEQTGRAYSGRVDAVALVSNQKDPSAIAVDAESIYWVSDFGSTIKKVSKTGGMPTTLVTAKHIHQIVLVLTGLLWMR